MNVHLVDGTYELFRAFYAVPSAKNAAGLEVGAVRGLARSMLALLREPGASHVAVAFDHVIESFRNDLFAGYKTGEGIDPELWGQFELAERVCSALGIVVWPMIEFEADDALATAALRFAQLPEVEQVLIASPDKDLAQCVIGTRVVCLDRMRKKLLDEAGVNAKFGVHAGADPRLPRARRRHGGRHSRVFRAGAQNRRPPCCASTERSTPFPIRPQLGASPCVALPRWPRAWPSGARDALLYKRLATLRVDVPLSENLEDLRYRGARAGAARSARGRALRCWRYWSAFRNSAERC